MPDLGQMAAVGNAARATKQDAGMAANTTLASVTIRPVEGGGFEGEETYANTLPAGGSARDAYGKPPETKPFSCGSLDELKTHLDGLFGDDEAAEAASAPAPEEAAVPGAAGAPAGPTGAQPPY